MQRIIVIVGVCVLVARTGHAAADPCKFDQNVLTVSEHSVNLVATLEDPPKTRVTLSITGDGGFHRELVWDPAVGDGLQHDVLIPQSAQSDKRDKKYTVMAFAEVDRTQTTQVVVSTTTQFTACRKAKETARDVCPTGLLDTEVVLVSTTRTTTVVVGSNAPHVQGPDEGTRTPRLRLKCDSGTVELSELHLDRKELVAASVARGFLDQAAPAAVTDTLALLAEIAVERAKSGAFELLKDRIVDPICAHLNLRLLGLGGDEQAFPRTCSLLGEMRLQDLLSSGRSLVEAARDDVRLTLLPQLVAKVPIPSAAREVATLALRIGSELGDADGVAGLDLLVTQLDRTFLRGALASVQSYKDQFIAEVFADARSQAAVRLILQQALERALPADPGSLLSSRTAHTDAEQVLLAALPELKDLSDCERRRDNFLYFTPADKPACVAALMNKFVEGRSDWRKALTAALTPDQLVGVVSSARRTLHLPDFEAWVADKLQGITKLTVDGLPNLEPAKRTCAVRVAIAVIKWCSRRDSCTASEIAGAIDRPQTLFKAPGTDHSPDWLCWEDSRTMRLPMSRTVYVELASRGLAFLTPPLKGEERKRVRAIVHWVFDLAQSLDEVGAESWVRRLEEILELFEQRDYLRAISQTMTLAGASMQACKAQPCELPGAVKSAMKLFGAVASYLRVYEETASLDAAEAKAARKKAIESLIDGATDRRERGGDWIVGFGIPVGVTVGSRWTPGTDLMGYPSAELSDAFQRERAIAWRLPLGLSLQRLHRGWFPVGLHFAVTFADLGNFVRGRSNDEDDEIRWKDFLQLGGQAGFLIGNRRHSVVLALDVAWSPGLYERDVTINTAAGPVTRQLSGAIVFGVTAAYYVPVFDLN